MASGSIKNETRPSRDDCAHVFQFWYPIPILALKTGRSVGLLRVIVKFGERSLKVAIPVSAQLFAVIESPLTVTAHRADLA